MRPRNRTILFVSRRGSGSYPEHVRRIFVARGEEGGQEPLPFEAATPHRLGDALRMPIVISIPAEAVRRLVVWPAPRRRPSNGPPTKSILTGL
jgi:hypothetical protein